MGLIEPLQEPQLGVGGFGVEGLQGAAHTRVEQRQKKGRLQAGEEHRPEETLEKEDFGTAQLARTAKRGFHRSNLIVDHT